VELPLIGLLIVLVELVVGIEIGSQRFSSVFSSAKGPAFLFFFFFDKRFKFYSVLPISCAGGNRSLQPMHFQMSSKLLFTENP